jgi:DNA-binding transcriptional regulator PaaX
MNVTFADGAEQSTRLRGCVPEGWKLVPVEPTDKMFIVGGESWFDGYRAHKPGSTLRDQDAAASVYRAMLTAAPQAPADVVPAWEGGRPANLVAAAKDADEWLAMIQRLNDAGRWKFSEPDSRSKLDGSRAALAAMSTKAGGV